MSRGGVPGSQRAAQLAVRREKIELTDVLLSFALVNSEQIGAVESVKAASDIYSPVAGNVTAVNDKLSSEANLLNKSPEKDGE